MMEVCIKMKRVPIKLREPIVFDKQFSCPYERPFGYIYKVTNLINGHMYIGKHEFSEPHLDYGYHGSGYILQKAYEKYGKENFSMEILEWINTNNSDLNKAEIKWIDVFSTFEFPQHYNMTPGGDGMTSEMVSGENNPMYNDHRFAGENNYFYGKRLYGEANPNWKGKSVTQFQREYMSKIMTGKEPPNKGVPMSPERLKQHKEAMRKLSKNENWHKIMLKAAIKRSNNPEWHKKIKEYAQTRKIPIIMLTLNDEPIKLFDSASTVKNFLNRDCQGNISKCCNNKIHSAYGYHWMYLSDYEEKFGPLRTPITLS